jgi:hypothetical protein
LSPASDPNLIATAYAAPFLDPKLGISVGVKIEIEVVSSLIRIAVILLAAFC